MPIAKTEKEIEEILNKRHDIPSLFAPRDASVFQRIVDELKGESVDVSTPKIVKESAKESNESNDEDDFEELMSDDSDSKPTEEIETNNGIEESESDMDVEDAELESLLNELND